MTFQLRPQLVSLALLATSLPLIAAEGPAHATWVDVDGDGLLDLFAHGPNGVRLHLAQADGGFRDVTRERGFDPDRATSQALWADADGDGDLDVALLEAGELRLLENTQGAFSDATAASGLSLEEPVLSAAWHDVDGDGRPELELRQIGRVVVQRRVEGVFEGHELALPRPAVPAFEGDRPVLASPGDATTAGGSAAMRDRERERAAAGRDPSTGGRDSKASAATASGTSVGGAPGGSRSAASANFGCAQSIADSALPGTCIAASSTPLPGALMPLDRILWAGEASEAMWFDYDPALDAMSLFGGVFGGFTSGPILTARRADSHVGIGTQDPLENLHVSGGSKSATLLIEADTSNSPSTESAHPQLRFLQDGAQMEGLLGFVDGSNDLALRHVTEGHELRVTEAGQVALYEPLGDMTIELDVDEDGGGALSLFDTSGIRTVDLEAREGIGGANLVMRTVDGTATVSLDAEESDGSVLRMSDNGGVQTVLLAASEGATGGNLELFAADGTRTVELDADNTAGAELRLRDGTGANSITLHAGTGRITTESLSITGGADIAEPFDVRGLIEPGRVVAIDPERPGALRLSTRAYDATVAGVVSGAGGIQPGLTLVQEGTLARGEHPVALSGRVWCWANASAGPIVPGDLLTSSDRPGEAMRVDEPARAFGTVLGKAMTPLEEGSGLVLVLVGLQ